MATAAAGETAAAVLGSHRQSHVDFRGDMIPSNHNLSLIFIFYMIFNIDGKTARAELQSWFRDIFLWVLLIFMISVFLGLSPNSKPLGPPIYLFMHL